MNEIVAAAAELQAFFAARDWNFCFIGGLAVQRWGEVRYTKDADATLLTGFGREEQFVDALLAGFAARTRNMRDFALRNRVLLLESSKGVALDISLGAFEFEHRAVEAATDAEYAPGVFLRTCSAEDLIVFKAFAEREQDWVDIRGIVVRQGHETLNWERIDRHLGALAALKESPQILTRLAELRERARREAW